MLDWFELMADLGLLIDESGETRALTEYCFYIV